MQRVLSVVLIVGGIAGVVVFPAIRTQLEGIDAQLCWGVARCAIMLSMAYVGGFLSGCAIIVGAFVLYASRGRGG